MVREPKGSGFRAEMSSKGTEVTGRPDHQRSSAWISGLPGWGLLVGRPLATGRLGTVSRCCSRRAGWYNQWCPLRGVARRLPCGGDVLANGRITRAARVIGNVRRSASEGRNIHNHSG